MSKSNNKNSITSLLVDITKFSGKFTIVFLIIGLVLVGVTVSLANPQGNSHTATGQNNSFMYFTVDKSGGDNVQFVFAGTEGQSMVVTLEKLEYIHTQNDGTNVTLDHPEAQEDVTKVKTIFSVNTSELARNDFLDQGEYRVIVDGEEGEQFILGVSQFDLPLVVFTSITLAIFSVMMSIFFTVLPFTILALIIESVENGKERSTPEQYSSTENFEQPSNRTQYNQASRYEGEPIGSLENRSDRPKKSGWLKETPFESLIQTDWIAVGMAVFFFLFFIAEVEVIFLFLSICCLGYVVYSVTERDRTKEHIMVLLSQYDKISINYLAEQLDKDQDNVEFILRRMILDDGYPIRLNLKKGYVQNISSINKTEETTVEQTEDSDIEGASEIRREEDTIDEPEISSSEIEDQENRSIPSENKTEQPNQPVGQYCSNCGEELVNQVKYCYICGTRQES